MIKLSTVRTLCLLVIFMGLLLLYAGVYVEQSRPSCDHVMLRRSRDNNRVAMTTRAAVDVTSSRREPSEGVDGSLFWDYNWDSYVCALSHTRHSVFCAYECEPEPFLSLFFSLHILECGVDVVVKALTSNVDFNCFL